ncbi:DUF4249 domain-containing protein [Myroides sp. WP-1]|uniref:DUF4249 domain-containing protein n=1 Tax=Myroides sp. WP-1 TaxID=2759944 RepID=UPI0015F94750|nr:DUF4249 domain-containing protein [Myroides sp. WP-1]MBB1139192.1 DUF4249 domain-containing protein [Myroides sp. WP-1]
MRILPYILILFTLSFTSCTKVIDIDLPTAEPRLVVEGNLDFNKMGDTDTVFVKLSLTTDYFNTEIPPVNNAIVRISDKQGNQFLLRELAQTGSYYTTEIAKPVDGDTFKLQVEYDNDLYEATETYSSSPEILEITQKRERYFEKDYYVLRVYYQDTPRATQNLNYYYFFYQYASTAPQPRVLSNEYSKGNKMESLFIIDEDARPGEKVEIEFAQISRNYHDFAMSFFDAIGNGGGPFQVPSGRIIGNMKNKTTPEKEALGYFRVIEKQTATHTIFEQSKQ